MYKHRQTPSQRNERPLRNVLFCLCYFKKKEKTNKQNLKTSRGYYLYVFLDVSLTELRP